MDLREQIADIVSDLIYIPLQGEKNRDGTLKIAEAPNFLYGRKPEINVQGDNARFPAIILIEPDQFGFKFDSLTGNVQDRANVFIQFVNEIDEIEDANYRHPVVMKMKRLAIDFIQQLNRADIFEDLNPNIPGILVVDSYDVNVAGLELNFAQLTDIYPAEC